MMVTIFHLYAEFLICIPVPRRPSQGPQRRSLTLQRLRADKHVMTIGKRSDDGAFRIDQLGDLMKATVGLNLQFHLRIELGPASRASDETIDKVNDLLSEVSRKLRLQ